MRSVGAGFIEFLYRFLAMSKLVKKNKRKIIPGEWKKV
jgi:hypothetical protein